MALHLLTQAARDVALGQISLSGFAALLDRQERVCQEQLAAVTAFEIPEDLRHETAEEMALGLAGIHHMLVSLETLRGYLTDRRLPVLEEGLEQAREATELLNKALECNWTSYYAFKESMEEYLTQLGPGGPAV